MERKLNEERNTKSMRNILKRRKTECGWSRTASAVRRDEGNCLATCAAEGRQVIVASLIPVPSQPEGSRPPSGTAWPYGSRARLCPVFCIFTWPCYNTMHSNDKQFLGQGCPIQYLQTVQSDLVIPSSRAICVRTTRVLCSFVSLVSNESSCTTALRVFLVKSAG